MVNEIDQEGSAKNSVCVTRGHGVVVDQVQGLDILNLGLYQVRQKGIRLVEERVSAK